MNRIYQGRVTFAEINGGKDEKGHPRWIPLDQWSTVIWRHHELFQDAVNYYLFCLAALSSAESSAMGKMRRQLSDVWAPYTLRGKPVRGLRAALAPYLGIGSSAGIEEGFAAVLAGNESEPELLQLAVDSMVLALGGGAKIQKGCRTYWPMFCKPEFKGTFPNSNAKLERNAVKDWLPAWLHDPETAKDLPGAAARLKLGLFANAAAGKADLVGDEAREKLHKAITQLGTERPAAKAQLDGLKRLVDALPETVSITPYVGSSAKGAAKDRLNAFLLFKFVAATDFTFGLLRDAYPAPEQAKWPAAIAESAEADPLLKFGDDPIRLARGARGFVFRAFTSHACWGGTGPTSAVWSEFDIAAFKEALKTANQFRLKTEERLEKAGELQAELDWMDGKVQKRRAVEQAEGDEEGGHAILGGDPRLKIVKHLFEVELAEEHYLAEGESVAYGLHPRTLRCYRELVGVWNKKVDPGEPFSEELYKKLIEATNEFQTANRDLMGSATLFRKLLEKDYWCLWIAPNQASAAQRQKAGFSERIIEDYQHYLELQSDIVRLKEPIRFTPADAELSRRLYMFSDLDGRAEREHLPNATPHGFGVDVSLAVDLGGIWKETRVRLSYSAPRLCRDGLRKTSGEDLEKVPWLQPMMAAMNLPEPSLQDFSKCAVSLMPNRQGDGFRHLLNFPVQLDADVVRKAVGAESRWEKQFVAYGKSAGEKKWFLSWPREAKPALMKVGPWWERLNAFSCMAVDLGQRDAGAYAVMDVRADMDWGKKPARKLGATEGRSWSTTLAASGVLRLPGEDAKVLRDGKWQEELYGEKGRSASGAEWQEARDLVRGLARYIADEGAETAGEEAVINSWLGEDSRALSFPKLNDKLLVVARRAQGWLARCHRWLWMLGDEKKKDRALEEVREQERRPDWASHAKAGEVDPLTQLIKGEIGLLNTFLPDQLVRLANRCAPLRGRRWAWNKHPIPDFARKGCHLLEIVEAADHMPPVAGQRGLSLERIEQLEELRRRFQSLNRALQRGLGSPPKSGSAMRNDPLPDCCPDILEKLDRIKNQRVNQTAHLILAQALGVRLRAHNLAAAERTERDIHGEYEAIPGRKPVDFVVLEDLAAYTSSQTRGRKENLRLMKWCHRQVTAKTKEMCEVFGIPMLETPAAYSSKFCSRTGVAGFRARELRSDHRNTYPWKKRLAEGEEVARELFEWLDRANAGRAGRTPRTLLVPVALGPIFVPASKGLPVMQADINAAINLALRATAAPEELTVHVRIRSESAGGTLRVRAESNREKARWVGGGPEIKMVAGPQEASLVRGGGNPNFFVDLGRVGVFDKADITGVSYPVSSGRGLWKSVRDREWGRCREINAGRMRQWGFEVDGVGGAASTLDEDEIPM